MHWSGSASSLSADHSTVVHPEVPHRRDCRRQTRPLGVLGGTRAVSGVAHITMLGVQASTARGVRILMGIARVRAPRPGGLLREPLGS